MIFTEEFLDELKAEPFEGTVQMINIARNNFVESLEGWTDHDYQVLLETFALIIEIVESKLLNINNPNFAISGDREQDCKQINAYLTALEKYCISESSKLKVESFRSHFKTALGSGFAYEFSQGDLERVQLLINEIRELIANSTGLEKDHQRRLLTRLEKLQSEMHKKISDLDRFWGLIGDAGVVLGKLGNDAKPIVDRIKEVADIVWQTQSRSEELPSGTQIPLIADRSKGDKEV
jgi:hypothetical protein